MTVTTGFPTGTVTFLFTDIEGSTRAWEEHQSARGPSGMARGLARHNAIITGVATANGGYVFKTIGDAFCIAFATADDALATSIDVQLALAEEDWGALGVGKPVRVRMALHTGPAQEQDGDYFGPTLNRTARILATGHGGQVLVSMVTTELVRDHLLGGMALRDLGEHRLRDLARPERIFQLDCPPLPVDFPSLRSLDSRPHNLPVQLTAFVGRETALTEAATRLRDPGTRLLTLLGPGGTGKTRIALQLAADCLDDFRDGAFFVALAPVRDTEHVAMAIASVLGLTETGGGQVQGALAEYLATRNLLLVLDNFEQVVDASPLVSELLRGALAVKIVVTSREALRISGERVLAVPPLELPSLRPVPTLERLVQFEAVRLFIDRATLVKADFSVTNANAPAVAEICHRLDGLPLAIELAASRVRLFEPETLLLRLDRGLGTMLTGGSRDLSARQQTLRGAIAWSVELLSAEERMLFIRLGVFLGGFTVEAAESVGSDPANLGMVGDLDVLSGIESLSDKSLVRRDGGTVKEPRFRMLETIRDHASGMAREGGTEEVLRDRHLQWITELFTRNEDSSRQVGGAEILERLHAELGNLRQALVWGWEVPAEGKRVTLAMRTCVAGMGYWRLRHDVSEGRIAIDRLLALVDPLMTGGSGSPETLAMIPPDVLAYARTLVMALRAHTNLGQPPTWVQPMLDEAVAHFQATGNRRGEARARYELANYIGFMSSDGPESREADMAAVKAASDAGDAPTIAFASCRLAWADLSAGMDDEGGERFATALWFAESSGDTWAIANSRWWLGAFLFNRRQWQEADSHFAMNDDAGGMYSAMSRFRRAEVAVHAGNFPRARAHLQRLSDGVASGHLPARYLPLSHVVEGQLARLEGRAGIASACFREALASELVTITPTMTQRVFVGLAMNAGITERGETARELLAHALALDPEGKGFISPLPVLIGAVAEWVVAKDPSRGIRLWAMSALLGKRARYAPMYPQDEVRITAVVDRAKETHGIPVSVVPANLTAADAIAECREALASRDGVQ